VGRAGLADVRVLEDNMNAPLTTPLTRRDPVYPLTPFGALFDEFFNDSLWSRPLFSPLAISSALPAFSAVPALPADYAPVARARMDVLDKGDSFLVTIEMPGVRKDDIVINIEGARVSITAETFAETPVQEGEKRLYTERFARSYARSFELPVDVTEVGADAVYENGVLRLTLPKRAPVVSHKVAVH
jgi:HSP20 family protein